MDSLQDILGGRDFAPPDEMQLVKDYIKRRYRANCQVRVEREMMIISLPNSALAATVQMERNSLIEACNIKTRLMIRIGR